MHPFQSVMIICIAALCLMAALFFIIRRVPRTNPGIDWWIASSLLLATSYLLAFIFYNPQQNFADQTSPITGTLVFYTLNMLSLKSLQIGGLRFLYREVNLYLTGISFLLIFTCTSTLLVIFQNKFWADILFVLYGSWSLFYMSWYYHRDQTELIATKQQLSVFLFLLGLHFLNYPWLHGLEWFSPIGFLIAVTLDLTIYGFLAALVISQFRLRTHQAQDAALQASTHDTLTGLSNRVSLQQLFTTLVSKPKAADHGLVLMYLDLDGFKAVNDTYGHKAGDYVLIKTAQRLQQALPTDANIARIGGDEFVILYYTPYALNQIKLQVLLRLLLDTISTPIQNDQETYQISASIGIAFYPKHGTGLECLQQVADNAMYYAKHHGANNYHFAD